MKIITSGRTDLDEYFKLSGVLEWESLNHTPFLAFVEKDDVIEVQIIGRLRDLLLLPAETRIMSQWQGQWRSDFFTYDVYDIKQAYEEKKERDAQKKHY